MMNNRGMSKAVVIAVLGLFVAGAISQSHIYPALDTNNVFTGQNAFSGPLTASSINSILYADPTIPGGFANVQAAITACPTAGCTIYANSPTANLSLGTIDPGSKFVTLYLGPYSYNATQVVLRSNLHLFGAGSVDATFITQANGSVPLFAIGGSSPIAGVIVSGLQLQGAAGGTADAISLVAPPGGGIWYSQFSDIFIGQQGSSLGFGGIALDIDAQAAGAINQFLTFTNVRAFRNPSGPYALKLIGQDGQISFYDSQFDGQSITEGTNIWIGQGGTSSFNEPYNINFSRVTSQTADMAVSIAGAYQVAFNGEHCEQVHKCYLVNAGSTLNSYGIVIENSFSSNAGINSGAGYILNVAAGQGLASVTYANNQAFNTPDALITGTLSDITSYGVSNSSGVQQAASFPGGIQSGSGSGAALGSGKLTNSDLNGFFQLTGQTSFTYTFLFKYSLHPRCSLEPEQALTGTNPSHFTTYNSAYPWTVTFTFTSVQTGFFDYNCTYNTIVP